MRTAGHEGELLRAALRRSDQERHFAGTAANRATTRPTCIFHRKLGFDKGPQLSSVEKVSECRELFPVLLDDEESALHAWICVGFCVCGDRHQPSARLENTAGSAERISTNCVENYIDHVFIFKTARAVIDDLICPELLHEIHVCF